MAYTEFHAPTDVFFGKGTELETGRVLKKYKATKVLVHYGSGSVVRSGLLDRVIKTIEAEGISYVELGGAQPNPRLSLVRKGIELGRKENVDFILAVGGGSAIDSAKAISFGMRYDGDVWDFFGKGVVPVDRVPVGVVLTLSATGSEMSNSCVVTNDEVSPNKKVGCNCQLGRTVFAIMNPELTYTVSKYQTGCGSIDIMMHTLERFFNDGPVLDFTDENCASVLKTIIKYTPTALEKPDDYEARANIMWAGSVSHNGFNSFGTNSNGDWASHRLELVLSAIYDVAHGAGLSAIWASWARYVCSVDYARFAKLGKLVFGFDYDESTAKEVCFKTIDGFERVFKSYDQPIRIHEMGVEPDDDMLHLLASEASLNGTRTLGTFKKLEMQDMYNIYKMAL